MKNKVSYQVLGADNYPINSGTNKAKVIKEAKEWGRCYLRAKPSLVKLPFQLIQITKKRVLTFNLK